MVPNFALSLSFHGISLLRQTINGWAQLGSVPLDHPDLEGAVRALKDKALALDPTGSTVAVILPNEQIRYLDLPQDGQDSSTQDSAIRAALDGATPYKVDDLVWDSATANNRLMIAAVARETLDEAEAFATTHGFTPVSFLAKADAGAFDGAVFFGASASWAGPAPTRPAQAIAIQSEAAKGGLFGAGMAKIAAPAMAAEPDIKAPVEDTPDEAVHTTPERAADDAAPMMLDTPVAPETTEVHDAPEQPEIAVADTAGAETPASTSEPELISDPVLDPPQDPAPAVFVRRAPEVTEAAQEDAPSAPAADAEPAAPDVVADTAAPDASDDSVDTGAENTAITASETDGSTTDEAAPIAALSVTPKVDSPTVAPKVDDAVVAPKADSLAVPPAPKALALDPLPEVTFSSMRATRATSETPLPPAGKAPALMARPDAKPTPAKARRLTPLLTRDSAIKDAGITSGGLEADDSIDAGADTAPRGGMFRAFTSRRSAAKDTEELIAAPAPAKTKVASPAPAAAPASPPRVAAQAALGRLAAFKADGDDSGKRPSKSRKPAIAAPVGAAYSATLTDERERMTVFGARSRSGIGGKPRFLGLMLTSALLMFLAGVAAWASVFLDDGLARFFRTDTPPTAIASISDLGAIPSEETAPVVQTAAAIPTLPRPAPLAPVQQSGETLQLASLETSSAITDATPEPVLSVPSTPRALTAEEAAATYAATGIWQRAPASPTEPQTDRVDNVYVASIDPKVESADAVALPAPTGPTREAAMDDPGLPPPAGLVFDLDERGLVRASPEGTLSPDGVQVFAGLPPVTPPLRDPAARPVVAAPELATPTDDTAAAAALAALRPAARPNNLNEAQERANLGGFTRKELAAIRPAIRPKGAQDKAQELAKQAEELARREAEEKAARELAAVKPKLKPDTLPQVTPEVTPEVAAKPVEPAEPEPNTAEVAPEPPKKVISGTKRAVATSPKPATRPRNMAALVRRAERQADRQEAAQAAPAKPVRTASIAPRTVKPKVPSSQSVAKQATVRNAINLSRINLIGVYGTPANRRALVRLANGRYQKVKVGDRIDGGRVSAIGEADLRYKKGGRNVTLKMPRS